MRLRPVRYVEHEVPDAHDRQDFILLEAIPERGAPRHAFAAPRGWRPLLEIPVDPGAGAPAIGSVVVEDPALGPPSGALECGAVPGDYADGPRAVLERLAARDGYAVYRWNDEDDAIGGARAMASTDTHLAALRVLPHADGWAFFSGIVPKDRLAEIGGALKVGLSTFQLYPEWAEEG